MTRIKRDEFRDSIAERESERVAADRGFCALRLD